MMTDQERATLSLSILLNLSEAQIAMIPKVTSTVIIPRDQSCFERLNDREYQIWLDFAKRRCLDKRKAGKKSVLGDQGKDQDKDIHQEMTGVMGERHVAKYVLCEWDKTLSTEFNAKLREGDFRNPDGSRTEVKTNGFDLDTGEEFNYGPCLRQLDWSKELWEYIAFCRRAKKYVTEFVGFLSKEECIQHAVLRLWFGRPVWNISAIHFQKAENHPTWFASLIEDMKDEIEQRESGIVTIAPKKIEVIHSESTEAMTRPDPDTIARVLQEEAISQKGTDHDRKRKKKDPDQMDLGLC